jgi:heme/copper-type cytochrome/quinol oxidase subunit 3
MSTDLIPADVLIGTPPPAPPARPRVLLIGTVLSLSAVVLGFAALLAIYIQARADTLAQGQTWLPKDVDIPLTPGTMGLVTLGLSAVIVQWAVYSISNDDRRHAYLALGLGVLMGAAYINGMAFYYSQMHLTIHEPVGLLIFAITGAHIAMAVGGMLFMGLVAFRTFGGQYSGHDREGLVAMSIYWYVTVSLYAVIWFTIFVKK